MTDLPLDARNVSELRRQCRHHNVFPIYLEDGYRVKPIAEVLKPLVEEAVGYLSVLDEAELCAFISTIPPGFRMMIGDPPIEAPSDAYRRRVAIYYLAAIVHRGYHSFESIVNCNLDKSEVLKVYPELKERFDHDGLLLLDSSFHLRDGGIEYHDHVLHYHQFLRRAFTSNPNFEFLGPFAQYREARNSCNSFRIAIDHGRIMAKEHFQQVMEFDTWYGPRFLKDDLDDLSKVGVTVVARSRPSPFDMASNIDRTEFYWKADRATGIKTCEIEELSSPGNQIESYYINRYIHAERDTGRCVLQHCDGAVKVYHEADYRRRVASAMPKRPKATAKIKLFRIDGVIDVDRWIHLTAMFFKGNEMIMEYFDPVQFSERFQPRIDQYQKATGSRRSV